MEGRKNTMSYNRTKKYTMREFRAISRNSDGDFTDMFEHFMLLTDEQVQMLTSDDQTRYFEYQEELQYELNSLKKEFGAYGIPL